MKKTLLVSVALQLALIPALAGGGEYQAYTFDNDEERIAAANEYPPWARLMARHTRERALLTACLADRDACPKHLRGYHYLIQRIRQYSPRRKLDLVNHYINKRHWVTEREIHAERIGDEWQTLNEFFAEGGDCEDFAIAKYFMLRDLGFAPDELRVVVAWDYTVDEYHAVVAVNLKGRVVLLETDNTIVYPRKHGNYKFLYSINEIAVWDHLGEPHRNMIAKSD